MEWLALLVLEVESLLVLIAVFFVVGFDTCIEDLAVTIVLWRGTFNQYFVWDLDVFHDFKCSLVGLLSKDNDLVLALR